MEGRRHLALLLQLIALARADCPNRVESLIAAREAVEEVDLSGAEERLRTLMVAFACGEAATRDQVAETFLLEGALASYRGDEDGLQEAFRSAAGVSEAYWLASLGAAMQEKFVAARQAPRGRAEIRFEPSLDGYTLYVDGQVATEPAPVSSGLHLLQLGEGERIVWATLVSVPADAVHVVEHELSGWHPEPVDPEPDPGVRPARRSAVALHVGVGVGVVLGVALDSGAGREPGERLAVPLELGASVASERVFARVAAAVAPALTGELLYASDEGARAAKASLGGHLAGGVRLGDVELGALSGPSWPGRWQIRAMAGAPVVGPLRAELRLGANAATERPPEAAAELVVALRLGGRGQGEGTVSGP